MLAILATISLFQNHEKYNTGGKGENPHGRNRVKKFRQPGGRGHSDAIHDRTGQTDGCACSCELSRQLLVELLFVKFVERHYPPPLPSEPVVCERGADTSSPYPAAAPACGRPHRTTCPPYRTARSPGGNFRGVVPPAAPHRAPGL